MIATWLLTGILVSTLFFLFMSAGHIRQPAKTLIIGCIGAALGGLINLAVTPAAFGQFSVTGLLCALVSASILLFGFQEMQTA